MEPFNKNCELQESEHTLVNSKKKQFSVIRPPPLQKLKRTSKKGRLVHGKREQVAARIVEYNEKASLVSSRVSVDEGETAESLDRKLDRLIRDLERYSSEYVFFLVPLVLW